MSTPEILQCKHDLCKEKKKYIMGIWPMKDTHIVWQYLQAFPRWVRISTFVLWVALRLWEKVEWIPCYVSDLIHRVSNWMWRGHVKSPRSSIISVILQTFIYVDRLGIMPWRSKSSVVKLLLLKWDWEVQWYFMHWRRRSYCFRY